jgi:quercetin 2,3-dioxygenase
MNMTLYKAAGRGTADYGWLKPNYYFSFAQYYDPKKIHFGALRVLNDDFIDGGGGFPTHPHDNMEIVTIPFTGALQHKDSTGGQGVIKAGDIQIMSAGTGVQHSEANASTIESVTLFQIWVFPKNRNITPRYDQKTFDIEERKNKWQTVVSPIEADQALWINQDAVFSLTNLKAGSTINYTNRLLINGNAEVGGQILNKRDAIGIEGTDQFAITASSDAELLAIEIPMQLPQ